jgi:hypothetical protein
MFAAIGTAEEPPRKHRNQRLETLKGRGFQPRHTSFSKTYARLGSRALSKLQRREFSRKA